MIRIQQLKLPITHTEEELLAGVSKKLKIAKKDIISWEIIRQSVDARRKPSLFYVYTIDVKIENEARVFKKINDKNIMLTTIQKYQFPPMGEQQLDKRPIIVGAGPAGLFCAYMLAKAGFKPLILERGDEARVRQGKIEKFWETGILDVNSNVQFGEGGAGTFSDGKLNTSVKDASCRNRKVLEILVEAGAPAEILYQQKPHLGTDLLVEIVETLRKQIISMGGEFRFQSCVTDILIEKGIVVGITVNDKENIETQIIVCATGHSARDTFAILHQRGLDMSAKSFAVGVRIEHLQTMINKSQYGQEEVAELGAANYKLTHQTKTGRGVYSFCMCPGGYVVNASSELGRLAINGMSYQARGSRNANSAVVVTVSPDDYEAYEHESGAKALRGIAFQAQLEECAYKLCEGSIPIQRFADFKAKQASQSLGRITPCIKGQYKPANIHDCLPPFVGDSIIDGIMGFNSKIRGFADDDAILSGIESRTSSPVRINRDEHLQANIKGFYPCGEGAGYAGGITSAAIDGIKIAEEIHKGYKNLM